METEPTKTVTTHGMTTFGDLLRMPVVNAVETTNHTCDVSLSLGELATEGTARVTTHGIFGIKHSEGKAMVDPNNPTHIQLFLVEVTD